MKLRDIFAPQASLVIELWWPVHIKSM